MLELETQSDSDWELCCLSGTLGSIALSTAKLYRTFTKHRHQQPRSQIAQHCTSVAFKRIQSDDAASRRSSQGTYQAHVALTFQLKPSFAMRFPSLSFATQAVWQLSPSLELRGLDCGQVFNSQYPFQSL